MDFADAIFYFPLDWTGPVRRALKATQASIVLIVETEIWPNFLRECRRANVPVIFVNGRLSQRSFGGFLRALSYSGGLLRGFLAKILNDASLFLMQGAEDAARLLALGAPKERVIVTGNLKYDLAEPPESALSAWLEAELARGKRGPVLIAGSVMANEEAMVLGAFAGVEREFPGALLILAPRKPDQFDHAAAIISQAGRPLVRRSEISLNGTSSAALAKPGNVFLLDTLGELAGIYRLADAVFVGGSLVPVGGHNILEPAAFGKVPVYGPFMENFREMAAAFLDAGASIRVATAEELGSAWSGLLRDPERAARMGAAARELVDRNRGATQRVLGRIEKIMDATGAEMKRPAGWPRLLWPLSVLYSMISRVRAWCYARGIFRKRKLPGTVISVGNLTAGGTGKTPMVLWIAERLAEQGKHAAILTRGYRGTSDAVAKGEASSQGWRQHAGLAAERRSGPAAGPACRKSSTRRRRGQV